MNRRFVNLLVDKFCPSRPAYELHRIDPASLFYPTGSADPAATWKSAPAPGRLPPAAFSFDLPCKRHQTGWMDFMALKKSIVAVDNEGRTLLYDSSSRAVLATNPMRPALRSNNMFVTVGDSLYVMSSEAGLPSRLVWFYALIYGKSPYWFGQEDWYWRSLELPPFYHSPAADDDYSSDDDADCSSDKDSSPDPCAVSAFTVVGNTQIWVSTVGAGTYSYDTVSRKWSKVASFALPFRGRAVHVPEHNLWFGFSDHGCYQLCAVDLALTQQQPVLHRLVLEDPPLPQVGSPTATHLFPLGSGKLCVARLFQETEEEDKRFALFTGVEVRRAAGVGNLQVVYHKSRIYSLGKYDNVRLL